MRIRGYSSCSLLTLTIGTPEQALIQCYSAGRKGHGASAEVRLLQGPPAGGHEGGQIGHARVGKGRVEGDGSEQFQEVDKLPLKLEGPGADRLVTLDGAEYMPLGLHISSVLVLVTAVKVVHAE